MTDDGIQFWYASSLNVGNVTDSGIGDITLGATTTSQIGPVGSQGASIGIAGNQLYVSASGGNLSTVGSGLPTTTSTLTGLPGLATAYATFFPDKRDPEQFLLLNTTDGSGTNPNVADIADQANGLLKFWLDGTNTWQFGGPGGSFGQKLLFAGGRVAICRK